MPSPDATNCTTHYSFVIMLLEIQRYNMLCVIRNGYIHYPMVKLIYHSFIYLYLYHSRTYVPFLFYHVVPPMVCFSLYLLLLIHGVSLPVVVIQI